MLKSQEEMKRIIHMAQLIEKSLLAAQEKVQKRMELRGMAMMFHPTNGRFMFESLSLTAPIKDISLSWTFAIECVIVEEVINRITANQPSATFESEIGVALQYVCGIDVNDIDSSHILRLKQQIS